MQSNDIWSIGILLAVLAALFAFLTYVIRRVRKGGGSMTTIAMGATDEFLNKDQSKAVEVIVERNAGKKLEEQESGSPQEGRKSQI